MPQLHRLGDANTGGGIITTIPQSTVFANGRLVAVNGSQGTGHAPFVPPHLDHQWTTTSGGPTVFAEGIPVNKQGDPDSCGHARAAGSPDVFVHG